MLYDEPDFEFEMARGDHRTLDITVYQSDGSTPQNITGATIWVTGKLGFDDDIDDSTALFQLVTGGQVAVVNAAQGTARANLLPAHTASAPANVTVRVDVQIKLSGTNEIITPAWGYIHLRRDVTRTIA